MSTFMLEYLNFFLTAAATGGWTRAFSVIITYYTFRFCWKLVTFNFGSNFSLLYRFTFFSGYWASRLKEKEKTNKRKEEKEGKGVKLSQSLFA